MFSNPGKTRIIARDPYSGQYINSRGLTSRRARAMAFTFEEWEAAITHCRARGMDDIDFLLKFPGVTEPICFRVRVANPHPLVDYASLS